MSNSISEEQICHICLSDDVKVDDDQPLICDRCGEIYCYDCSYTFTLHYDYQGSLCYRCSGQQRKTPLNRRDYKISYLLR